MDNAELAYLEIAAKNPHDYPIEPDAVARLIESYKEVRVIAEESEERLKQVEFDLEYAQRDICDLQHDIERLQEEMCEVHEQLGKGD